MPKKSARVAGQQSCPGPPLPLVLCARVAYPAPRADGRMTAGRKFRGKSGLHEGRVPGNARRGQPQGKRHREETAMVSGPNLQGLNPDAAMVMVKRWGKSPPRTWQQGRYGKPHPEQCRIGASRGKVCPQAFGRAETSTGIFQPGGPGWQLDCVGNGAARGMVIHGRKLPGQNPAYRLSAQIQPESDLHPEFQDPDATTDALLEAGAFRMVYRQITRRSGRILVEKGGKFRRAIEDVKAMAGTTREEQDGFAVDSAACASKRRASRNLRGGGASPI